MNLTYDRDICPAEWVEMVKDAQIRDGKRKYQPPPESPETEVPKRSIRDILLNPSHPWGYDKLGKTNLFHLFTAAGTQCLYTRKGDAVRVDQLRDKFVILYLLRDDVRNVATCPEYIPDLIETYQIYGKSELEIVFIWLGDDKEAFSNQFYMPWLAVLPEDERTVNVLTEEFDFIGPVCFLLFDRNGFLCLYDARANINAYGVLGFPFTHEKIEEVDKEAAKLLSEIINGKPVTLPDILGAHVISPTGDKVPTSDLINKTVGLYMLNEYPSRIILEELKRICEDKKEDFVLIPIITSYHSSWSWIRAGCSHLERSIPWYTLPAIKCRYLNTVFHNKLKEPYFSYGACDLVILKGDKHIPVSYFALHIFACFGVDAYPFTIENAVQVAKKEQQGNIVLKEILSSKSILRRQDSAGSEEVITVSELDGRHVLLLFGTHGCEWESFLSTIKNWYVDKPHDVDFEIIYIHLDISLESTSFSSTIEKMPWVVHSSKPEVAVSLFECVFPISAHLPAIAAFGVNGHLETKGSDLASNDKLVSQYPFIQADMYDEVYQELKDEHGWDLKNLFPTPAEIEISSLMYRRIYG
nr:PREDICTED: probable nucleoredoxin 2 [Daucus carota subsp. sativus]XP_017225689.1 PREDICTED: probable nucleoredoxin 2 [Daucus carota subsp. sativus]